VKVEDMHCNGRITWEVEHELPDSCDDILKNYSETEVVCEK
jgi:hypothetical protein